MTSKTSPFQLVAVDGQRRDINAKPIISGRAAAEPPVALTDLDIPQRPANLGDTPLVGGPPSQPGPRVMLETASHRGRGFKGVDVPADLLVNFADAIYQIRLPNSLVEVSGEDSFVRILDESCTVLFGDQTKTPAATYEELSSLIRRLTTRLERVDGISRETREARSMVRFDSPAHPQTPTTTT